jgi:hypothetical protein
MGFNRRKMEGERKAKADAEAAARRATDAHVLQDAERLIGAWNERQARRMPLLFAPTIGAALAARYHFLWVYCQACRTTRDIDLRTLDRHRDAAVTSLIPSLSCRSCRPHAPCRAPDAPAQKGRERKGRQRAFGMALCKFIPRGPHQVRYIDHDASANMR